MSVYSASRDSYPLGRSKPSAAARPSAVDWARKQFTSRATRRLAAAGQRAEHRLAQNLGPSWRVVEGPQPGMVAPDREHAGFLAIGPGGVYAVSVVDQGRQRVMIAGDVVQIQGKRPPHVPQARKYAKHTRAALSSAVGATVPVVAVLTFVGTGPLSAHGLPTGCLIVNHRELDRLLLASGDKITAMTAQKLADVAAHPGTWAAQYRWYPEGQTASGPGDKRATPR